MPYLLDANTIIGFLTTDHREALATVAAAMPLVVVEEVRGEVDRRDPPGKRWWSSSNIVQRAIALGSPAHATLVALGSIVQRGLGERASIALAVHDPTLVFVTSDKGAVYIAQRELWGDAARCASLAVFLRLARTHGLAWAAIDDVYRESKVPQPTWWAAWRASG